MRTKKIVISGLITVAIVILLFPLFTTIRYCHRTEWHNFDKLWLFQDSVKPFVDTLITVSEIRGSDALYWYHLYNIPRKGYPLGDSKYHVLIWEFNNLETFNIKDCRFNTNVNLNIDNYDGGVVENKNESPSLFIKSKMPFNNFINVNLNESSTILKMIDSTDYKGFYGRISKLSLNNVKNELFALFENQLPVNTLFLIYKKQMKLYVIYVFTDYEFNGNELNLFSLKN